MADAKALAKALGVPLAGLSAVLRVMDTPANLEQIRQSGGSERDVMFEKIDTGVDLTVIAIGVFGGGEAFVGALVYTGADYLTGGNLSKAVDGSARELAKTPEKLRQNVIKVDNKVRNTWMDSFIRSFMHDDSNVAR